MPFMQNHHYMIETKSAPESQRPRLITPINGGSYCISRTHLRVEVNTFVMVMIMASDAPTVSPREAEKLAGAILKDVNASALLIKNERVSAAAIKQGKVCQVLCMICVINFHYKVFINLFFLLPHDSPRVRIAASCARLYARVVVSCRFSSPTENF